MDVPDVLTLVIQALTSIDICITLCAIIHIENIYLDHVAYKLGKVWFPSYPNTLTLINFTVQHLKAIHLKYHQEH